MTFNLAAAAYALFTLYMILVLLRWLGPHLALTFHGVLWKQVPKLTDPLLDWIRRVLPRLSPFDVSPIVAVLGLWLIRTVVVGMLLPHHMPGVGG